jgi:uncharacterized protein
VKIDPKSIGVGQYQHDVSATGLKKSLDEVVDSCVNQVGVNVNTASYHLLGRVSGIGPGLAKAIVEHRAKVGLFKSRDALLEVPRFSKKTFEQAAGFLRCRTRAAARQHRRSPERYAALGASAASSAFGPRSCWGPASSRSRVGVAQGGAGAFTFDDVVRSWRSQGAIRATRFVPFSFRPTFTSSRICSRDGLLRHRHQRDQLRRVRRHRRASGRPGHISQLSTSS